MNEGLIDLTAKEIERLAAEVWDVAAKEALAKGLPVTGYHDGRLFRYHPGKGIEDFATGSCNVGFAWHVRDPAATTSSDADHHVLDTPEFPAGEPLGVEATAESGEVSAPSQPPAAERDATANAAAAYGAYAVECQTLTDYAVQTMAFARQNATETLEFTARLFAAKTFAEVVELSAAHFARQIETFASRREPVAHPSAPVSPSRPDDAKKREENGGTRAGRADRRQVIASPRRKPRAASRKTSLTIR